MIKSKKKRQQLNEIPSITYDTEADSDISMTIVVNLRDGRDISNICTVSVKNKTSRDNLFKVQIQIQIQIQQINETK